MKKKKIKDKEIRKKKIKDKDKIHKIKENNN